MSVARVLLVCAIGCLLVMTSGCGRAAYSMWDYTVENFGGEAGSDVVVAYPGQAWPLGNGFRGGGAEAGMGGDIGPMPRTVTISFTSKDKRRHRIYVAIPPEPSWFRPESTSIYFEVLSRCKAIATWQDPDTKRFQFSWSYARGKNGTAKFSVAELILGDETVDLWMIPSGTTHVDIPKPGWLRDMDVRFRSHDGRRHQVHVALPVPVHLRSQRPVAIHLFIKSADKVIVRETQLPLKATQRWFCAVADSGKQVLSDLTVTGHGKSYSLGNVGPKSDASLSALGPMPKALTVGFTSPDGTRHKVRVQAASAPTFHGSKTPELYVLIGSHAKLTASWLCPPLLKYKPPPHWEYTIYYSGTGTLSHVTMAYNGEPPARFADPFKGEGGMRGKWPVPKAAVLSFTTPDGKRHTAHLILPSFRGSGPPSFTLTIEKGGKVVATSP